MSVSLYQVDAFTDTPFAGNPAAVCLLPTSRSADWMQDVAAEMNLSETAFLRPTADGSFRLRWFTPSHEVDLCGHATLASAHVLWSEGIRAPDATARFETASGPLSATRDGDRGALDFPADPVAPADPPPGLLDGLGIAAPADVGRSGRDLLVRCDEAGTVRGLTPDFDALQSLDARGVIVTAAAGPEAPAEADFVSRFFAPVVGVPEDPVTGSAHCALGPYWAAETGRTTLVGRQVSARGGTVHVRMSAPDADRVTIAGRAVTTLRGRLDA